MNSTTTVAELEALAREAENMIQPAATQDERERWQLIAATRWEDVAFAEANQLWADRNPDEVVAPVPTSVTKKTSELVVGDVVNVAGMRCLIESDLIASLAHPAASGCKWTRALVLNREEVSANSVPFGWTRESDGSHRWTIQGNDLARWDVEA